MNQSTATPQCNANLSAVPFAIFICLHGVTALLATTGNLLVLLSIYKSPTLHRVSYYFIASLAVADLLVGVLVNPLYIALLSLRLWVSTHALYKVENFLWIQSLVASTYSLCAISVDRWLALTKVYSYPEIMTEKRARFIIVAVWFTSLVFASFTFLVQKDQDAASLLWTVCVIFTVGLPMALIVYCYFCIFQVTRRQKRSIAASVPLHLQPQNLIQTLKNKKAATTVAFVVGFFFLLFTPNFVFSCIEITTEGQCQKFVVYRHWLWAILVAYFSSAVNPFVYAVRSREFRAAFKRVIGFGNSLESDLADSMRCRTHANDGGNCRKNQHKRSDGLVNMNR